MQTLIKPKSKELVKEIIRLKIIQARFRLIPKLIYGVGYLIAIIEYLGKK